MLKGRGDKMKGIERTRSEHVRMTARARIERGKHEFVVMAGLSEDGIRRHRSR